MNTEQQVCSLELSKRLKKLGIKQLSLFYYCERLTGYHNETEINLFMYNKTSLDEILKVSAFTVAELLAMLPNRITLKEGEPFNSFRFRMEKSIWIKDMNDPEKMCMSDMYIVNYFCDTCDTGGNMAFVARPLRTAFTDENPANALAQALIYVIEYKIAETAS